MLPAPRLDLSAELQRDICQGRSTSPRSAALTTRPQAAALSAWRRAVPSEQRGGSAGRFLSFGTDADGAARLGGTRRSSRRRAHGGQRSLLHRRSPLSTAGVSIAEPEGVCDWNIRGYAGSVALIRSNNFSKRSKVSFDSFPSSARGFRSRTSAGRPWSYRSTP